MSNYDDIIDIDYPFDLGHKRMSNYDRCSQFMPFSALTGYNESVVEAGRVTSDRVFLDEDVKQEISKKLNIINSKLSSKPSVHITYFVSDMLKPGGSYEYINDVIKKIDLYNNIVFIGDKKICINDIVNIDCYLFDSYNFC